MGRRADDSTLAVEVISERPVTPTFKAYRTGESSNGWGTFAEAQVHRHDPVKTLKHLEDPLAEVLDRQAMDLSSETLKCAHSQAVVSCGLERIRSRSGGDIQMKGKIQTEPLPIPALMLQHPHMGPETQVIDADHIERMNLRGHQSGSSLWVKLFAPEA